MEYAYILENQGPEDKRDNSPIFKLIRSLRISEENVIIDNSPARYELVFLLQRLTSEDTLLVRSVQDFADTFTLMENILEMLTEKKVTLYTNNEPSMCGTDCFCPFEDVVNIMKYLNMERRKAAYKQAVEDGRVGRPSKAEEIQKGLDLYATGRYTMTEIEALTGVSRSTLYRNLKG